MATSLPVLDDRNPLFPPVDQALDYPEGLLAAGGNLEPETLLQAYRSGIFPWYEAGQPILWWSPSPRCVLKPENFHNSRSLLRGLRRQPWRISFNQCFDEVITRCATARAHTVGTWITPHMINAYRQLHAQGHAHSVEVWLDGTLVGGLYGVQVGALFCGESMFSLVNDASKLALRELCLHGIRVGVRLIDCQLPTEHLMSMGAHTLPRDEFITQLEALVSAPIAFSRDEPLFSKATAASSDRQ